MRKILLASLAVTISIIAFSFLVLDRTKNDDLEKESSSVTHAYMDFEIGKPIIAENLQIFPIKGKGKLDKKKYVTLTKAMSEGKVFLNETGSVNELSVDNQSNEYVYIQSGDIVKGGRQDRTIQYDVILPPNSKDIKLSSFCVEQSRWSKRGGESDTHFSSNTKMLSSRKLKVAAKYQKDQSKVWEMVSEEKAKLSKSVSDKTGRVVDVNDNESSSSLQLTLETKELEDLKKEVKKTIGSQLSGDDVIGFAYAINGEVYGVDIYNNSNLYNDLKSKLLDAVIVEAISENDTSKTEVAKVSDVIDLLKKMDHSNTQKNEAINSETVLQIKEHTDKSSIKFTTKDSSMQSKWLHVNYIQLDGSIEDRESSRLFDIMPRN